MDPERPIEKLLRDYAKERRAQAGTPELHPTSRRVLQGEVARKYAGQPRPERRSWRPLWAWGLGFAVAGILVISVVVPTLQKPRTREMLARNEPVAATDSLVLRDRRAGEALNRKSTVPSAPLPAPAAAPSARETVGLTTNLPASLPTEARREFAAADSGVSSFHESLNKAVEQPAKRLDSSRTQLEESSRLSLDAKGGVETRTAATQLADRSAASAERSKAERAPAASSVAIADIPPAAAAPLFANNQPLDGLAQKQAPALGLAVPGSGVASDNSMTGARRGQAEISGNVFYRNQAQAQAANVANNARYSQVPQKLKVPSKAGGSSPAPNDVVLKNFQVEQNGQQLRVLDEDGSVYTGAVELPAVAPSEAGAAAGLGGTKQSFGATAKDAQTQNTGYNFAVRGTNRSLRQQVEFKGQLIPEEGQNLQNNTSNLNFAFQGGQMNLFKQSNQVQSAINSIQNTVVQNQAAQQNLPLNNSRIQGVLKVGNQEMQINALPEKR